jgi:membrane protein implicated in regulation of membrane protease activity
VLPVPSFPEFIIFLALIIAGLIAIILVKTILQLIIPIVAAAVVWFTTNNLTYAGIAFLAVAILQLILKKK